MKPLQAISLLATLLAPPLLNALGQPPAPVYMRLRVMTTKERHEDVNQSMWQLPNHTATEVLAMIADVKPTLLERYFSGRANLSAPVPVSPGEPPMTVGEFLNRSAANGASGCSIMPRLSLWEALDTQDSLLDTAAHLKALPIHPPMTALGLDNWANFASDPSVNASVVRKLFTELRAQGWTTLSVNEVGGVHSAEGFADMADFGTSVTNGAADAEPNWQELKKIKADPTIKHALLYIDFAGQMMRFMNNSSPDDIASALLDRIATNALQEERGYSFVYPMVQSFWDSTVLFTKPTGRYLGKSVYSLMCENIRAAVAGRPPADMPACKLYPGLPAPVPPTPPAPPLPSFAQRPNIVFVLAECVLPTILVLSCIG
eukprot:COSAG02_NODE_1091_length_14628_cov_1693.422810_4_plen_374_part_00